MEYRIDKTTKILYFILAGVCFLIGGGLLIHTFGTAGSASGAPEVIGSLLFIFMGIIIGLRVSRLSLMIDDYSLTMKDVFSSRTIQLSEIDGYRRGQKQQLFILLKNGGKRLHISPGLGRREELVQWLSENYADVDLRENKKEMEILLENEQFGVSTADRQARLETAKKIDSASTVIGTGLFFWAFFVPQPYELIMVLLFVMPWIARDYRLYGLDKRAWLLLIEVAIVAAMICAFVCRQAIVTSGKKVLTYSCIVVLAGLYSYSVLVFSNCYYDRSEPEVYPVMVMGKRINSGRSKSYYLRLSSWGPYKNGKEISVPRSLYDGVREQDMVKVVSKKGRWKMGWFWLEK